jgi:hypothetical protein
MPYTLPASKKRRIPPVDERIDEDKAHPFLESLDWTCRNWICIVVLTQGEDRVTVGGPAEPEEITWAYGDITKERPKVYNRTIKLNAKGHMLTNAYRELFFDIRRVVKHNGRIAMHDLHCGAAVLEAEFGRHGCDTDFWAQAAANGLCTMDRVLGDWVFGVASDPAPSGEGAVANANPRGFSFQRLANVLLPSQSHKMPGDLSWFVVRKLHQMAHEQAPLALSFRNGD